MSMPKEAFPPQLMRHQRQPWLTQLTMSIAKAASTFGGFMPDPSMATRSSAVAPQKLLDVA
jgi:hypothetical protein